MNFQAPQGDLTNAHAAVCGSHMSVQSNCPKGAILRTLYNVQQSIVGLNTSTCIYIMLLWHFELH